MVCIQDTMMLAGGLGVLTESRPYTSQDVVLACRDPVTSGSRWRPAVRMTVPRHDVTVAVIGTLI